MINNTTFFFADLLDIDFGILTDHGFLNIYLSDHQHDVIHENALYFLFKPEKFDSSFEEFCKFLRTNPLYIEEYDCDIGEVMFVFNFPKQYLNVLESYKKGKYSEFPDNFLKRYYPPFVNGEISKRWRICHRSTQYRQALEEKLNVKIDEKAELHDIMSPEDEIYNFNPETYNMLCKK